jgi:dUTP pyrophosphatase
MEEFVQKIDLELGVFKTDERAYDIEVAYEGTSACFDLKAIEDTVIPAGGSAMVEVGLKIAIPEGWYLEFATRSGMGIGKNLRVHPGIIDHGYTGPLGVKVFNLGDKDVTIEKGKGCVQVKTHKIPVIQMFDMNEADWKQYEDCSVRGENGFGSSDKK